MPQLRKGHGGHKATWHHGVKRDDPAVAGRRKMDKERLREMKTTPDYMIESPIESLWDRLNEVVPDTGSSLDEDIRQNLAVMVLSGEIQQSRLREAVPEARAKTVAESMETRGVSFDVENVQSKTGETFGSHWEFIAASWGDLGSAPYLGKARGAFGKSSFRNNPARFFRRWPGKNIKTWCPLSWKQWAKPCLACGESCWGYWDSTERAFRERKFCSLRCQRRVSLVQSRSSTEPATWLLPLPNHEWTRGYQCLGLNKLGARCGRRGESSLFKCEWHRNRPLESVSWRTIQIVFMPKTTAYTRSEDGR